MTGPLDSFPNVRVAVIGDVMLDRYLYGDVRRISPEAPVPVLRATTEQAVAGGAANVAANLAALGVQVSVVGICGDDEARDALVACLVASGRVDCSRLVATPGRRTTTKLRIIGAHQQIVRIDHEDVVPSDPELEARCVTSAIAAIDLADVVVLSDYNKGVCSDGLVTAVIAHATRTRKKVLVDPKRHDLSVYRGASLLTPNRKELTDATHMPCETDAQAAAAARRAQEACAADILLTRSEKGMSLFPIDGPASHLATVAQNVFDVSGAGDTVVAVMAAAVGAGLPLIDGMRLANHAAGIVVSKMGTATVTRAELVGALAVEHTSASIDDGRSLLLDDALAVRSRWANERLTVGVVPGCFDVLRPGDVARIRRAATSCDRLIVALRSDASVERGVGGERPAQNAAARAAVVGALKGVSAVVVFDEDTPLELVRALQPDVFVGEPDGAAEQAIGADIVRARGGRVLVMEPATREG